MEMEMGGFFLTCAPPVLPALCSAMCSVRSRYSPVGSDLGRVTGYWDFPMLAHEMDDDVTTASSWKILNHTLPLPSQVAAVWPEGTLAR